MKYAVVIDDSFVSSSFFDTFDAAQDYVYSSEVEDMDLYNCIVHVYEWCDIKNEYDQNKSVEYYVGHPNYDEYVIFIG